MFLFTIQVQKSAFRVHFLYITRTKRTDRSDNIFSAYSKFEFNINEYISFKISYSINQHITSTALRNVSKSSIFFHIFIIWMKKKVIMYVRQNHLIDDYHEFQLPNLSEQVKSYIHYKVIFTEVCGAYLMN